MGLLHSRVWPDVFSEMRASDVLWHRAWMILIVIVVPDALSRCPCRHARHALVVHLYPPLPLQGLRGRRDSDPGSGPSKSVRFGQVTSAEDGAPPAQQLAGRIRAARALPRLASSGRSVSGDFSDAQVGRRLMSPHPHVMNLQQCLGPRLCSKRSTALQSISRAAGAASRLTTRDILGC